MLSIVLVHLFGLALSVLAIVRSGERPQVLVYAFILDYALRLISIPIMLRVLARGPSALAVAVASVTALPPPGEQSHPLTHAETNQPVGFSAYVVVVATLAGLAFVLVNVNARHELDIDLASLRRDVGWAGGLATVYWLQGLVSRTIVIDPSASRVMNLGYNARDITVMAFAILTAGVAVMVRQMSGVNESGWVVLGPLLVCRFLFDVGTARRIAKPSTKR